MSASLATRWWVAPPGPEETLSSLVARAATLYGWDAESLWHDLARLTQRSLGEVDDPTAFGLQRLGQTIGLAPAALRRHRVVDAAWCLAPSARQAVCEQCLAEDLADGCSPRRRAGWTRALVPVCPRHGTALRLEGWRRTGGIAGPSAELGDTDRAILATVHEFGATLEKALYFGGTWPAGWRGDPI